MGSLFSNLFVCSFVSLNIVTPSQCKFAIHSVPKFYKRPKNIKPQKSPSYLHTFVYILNTIRNKYRIEIFPWSLDSTKLQRKLVNGQFILGGGEGKNVTHTDRQTNRENENREPTTFYFFLIFRIMLYFF